MMEIYWKEKGQIKGLISNIRLILLYTVTVQLVIPDVRIKFQKPRLCISFEIFDESKKYSKNRN